VSGARVSGSAGRPEPRLGWVLIVVAVVAGWLLLGNLLPGSGGGAPGTLTASASSGTAAVDAASGLRWVTLGELPPEASQTMAAIRAGQPFPTRKDGSVFGNFEGLLPRQASGYYREFTVPTPGEDDRGARRIVTGGPRYGVANGEFYYTGDHYQSFERIRP